MVRPFSVSELYNLARTAYDQQFYGDESGSVREPFMSQEQFNALPERQRFDMAGQYTTGGTNVYRDENQNLVGYGDPRFIEAGAERWTVDPNQIQRSGDGRFSIASGNVNQGALDAIQRQTDQSGFFNGTPLQNIMKGAGIVLGAGALNNWMMDGSIFGAGNAGGMATDIPGGFLSESVAPQVTETMAGSPFGGSMWQNALNYATSNPLQTARGVGGLLGAATSLGGNQSPQGSPGGYQGPSGPVPSFNPVGAAGQFQQTAYKPMQFDPVPFMGDSTMFQNYSPYNSGFTGMGMPGQNPTMGFNQASPVQLPWMQNPSFGKPYMQGGAQQNNQSNAWMYGAQPSGPAGSASNPIAIGGYVDNNKLGQPSAGGGMGYAGSGPIPPGMTGNYTSPVQLPWGQPSQGAAQGAAPGMGGLLGNIGQPDFGPQRPVPPTAPGMSSRDMQMMARYLPGSGTTVDPNASPNALQNRFGGNFQNMIPQRLQGKWQQFQQLAGPMNSYEDWRNRYPGM